MKFKKIICTAITGIMLFGAAYVPSYAYNREYCDPFNENSDTLVTDDMEVFYEKEGDINSLLYTVREDGTAMITGWAGKFYAEGAEFEFDIPSNIKGHTVTAIADEVLCDGYARIVGISVPSTVKVIGVHAIDARYLKYLNLSERIEVIKKRFLGRRQTALSMARVIQPFHPTQPLHTSRLQRYFTAMPKDADLM